MGKLTPAEEEAAAVAELLWWSSSNVPGILLSARRNNKNGIKMQMSWSNCRLRGTTVVVYLLQLLILWAWPTSSSQPEINQSTRYRSHFDNKERERKECSVIAISIDKAHLASSLSIFFSGVYTVIGFQTG